MKLYYYRGGLPGMEAEDIHAELEEMGVQVEDIEAEPENADVEREVIDRARRGSA